MEKIKTKVNLNGLSEVEAKSMLKKHGLNEIKLSKSKNWIIEYLKEYTEIFSIILIIASLLAYFSKELVDALIIFSVVIINSFISFIQKFKADKAVESLQKLVAPTAIVFRDGKLKEIQANQLVPNDIIQLSEGMRIPADSIILDSSELYVAESILTGESLPVLKTTNTNENQLFMGTEVISGTAIAQIKTTGLNTKFGQIAVLTNNTKKEKSPLQKELDTIGLFVSKVTVLIAILIACLTILFDKRGILETLVFSSSVAVAAVPEGLPATVTIALALAVQRLAKQGAIVKQLSSVETLGCTTTILTDKTGTLTKNEMTVVRGYSPYLEFDVSGVGYNNKGEINLKSERNENLLSYLKLISENCNNAQINLDNQTIIGDPTDGAILAFSHKINLHKQKVQVLQTIPFNSVRKMMACLVSIENQNYILAKGAPDIVLDNCYQIFTGDEIIELSPAQKENIEKSLNQMTEEALRTIMLAYLPTQKNSITEADLKNLVFAGLIGIMDPPRIEIKSTVKQAKKAGIRIIMCTGDHANTAIAIGKQLKIIDKENKVLTGVEMQKMSDQTICELLSEKENIIFARVNPEDKLRVVELLKKNNEIVAVTGDGVNDAPALKKADIGVAMGITGTEVSKEAANMVLSKDNFTNIIDAISEGRTTYNNLKKFIYYIFSCNIGELTVIIAALLIGLPTPLTAILILSINIGTDIMPALSLAMEKPENDFMEKPPRQTDQKILQLNFNKRFIRSGFIIGLVALFIYIQFLWNYGQTIGLEISKDSIAYLKASSATFATLVVSQLFNSLNAKSEKQMYLKMNKFANPHSIFAILISLTFLIAIIEIPTLNNIFNTTQLTTNEWFYIIFASSFIFLLEETRKFYKMKTTIKNQNA